MKRYVFYLKTGQSFEVDCTNLELFRNGFGELAKIKWDSSGAIEAKLEHLNLDQLAAIIEVPIASKQPRGEEPK
ncbi:hypothetical protein COLU111180_12180 [Cohnella lubricantis]|uniref:Uncharacterized protein n=1 Tax=Cohnella lubricantis TaxID=2163172 RepID=A0A841T510_9BACL|nr:hypothetical protein [Cohnella lubricantis]MBB6675942.1 hypothetical protein [Cohnella lubricantis]MBP2117941.1 hypothetical protein [Cohnella lubricantis]